MTKGRPPRRRETVQHPRLHACISTPYFALSSKSPSFVASHHQREKRQSILKMTNTNISPSDTPLPPGWERKLTPTNREYFINHNSNTTSFNHPISQVAHGLPQGWELAQSARGTTYFIDHNTRATTWVDPRAPGSRETIGHGTREDRR